MQRRLVTRSHALPLPLSHEAHCYIATYIAAFGLLLRFFNVAILRHCSPTNNPRRDKISPFRFVLLLRALHTYNVGSSSCTTQV